MKTLRLIALGVTAILSGCGVTTAAFAQVAKPAAPVTAPAPHPVLKPRPLVVPLSSTERMAISALAEKIQANQKKRDALLASIPQTVAQEIQGNQAERDALVATVKQIEADIVVEHPGYHFDEATGTIVQDAVKAETPAPGVK